MKPTLLIITALILAGCASMELVTYDLLPCRTLVLSWMEAEHERHVDATQFWYTTDSGKEHAVGSKNGEYYEVWLYGKRIMSNRVRLSAAEIASGTHHVDYPYVQGRRVLSTMDGGGE